MNTIPGNESAATTTTIPILIKRQTHALLKARCAARADGMTYSRWIALEVAEWAEQMWALRALLCTPNHPRHWWPHAAPSRGKRISLTLPTDVYESLCDLAELAGNLKPADMCWTAILTGIANRGWGEDEKRPAHNVHINLSAHEADLFTSLGDSAAERTRAYTRAMRGWLMTRQSEGRATYAAHRRGSDNVRIALRLDPTLFVLVRELATIDEVQPAQAFYTIFRHAVALTVPPLPGAPCPSPGYPVPPVRRAPEPAPRFESTLKGLMPPVPLPTSKT